MTFFTVMHMAVIIMILWFWRLMFVIGLRKIIVSKLVREHERVRSVWSMIMTCVAMLMFMFYQITSNQVIVRNFVL